MAIGLGRDAPRRWFVSFHPSHPLLAVGAIFTPIGGGRLDKAQAFDVLAEALHIDERPIGAVRTDLFRLVFEVGGYALAQLDRTAQGRPPLVLWGESWQLLGALYEALNGLELEAMRSTHAANLEQFLTERAAEADAQPDQQP